MPIRDDSLRLHQFVQCSRVNGPGVRAVFWVQGCSLGCPGCFNSETHSDGGGVVATVDELFGRISAPDRAIEGVTISGGEPLQQLQPLLTLLRRVRRETALSVVLFSGFSWEEIHRMPDAMALLSCVDILLAGRYDASRRLARDLRGSSNKTAHFLTERYTLADLQAVPEAEVIITPDGTVVMSGIEPLQW